MVVVIIIGLVVFFISQQHHKKTVAATHPSSQSSPSSPSIIPQAQRYWILSASALNELVVNNSARQELAPDTIFVPMKKSEHLAAQASGLHIVPVESFTSEAALASAVNGNTIIPGVKVLLYDNEDWSLTPLTEQQNLLGYYQQAASIAHAHGYLLIGTPVSKTISQAAVQIAPYVDVLDIQSQYDQAVASTYAAHVLPLAQAARKANAKLLILSGLSTNPPTGIPTAAQLVNDAQAVSQSVQGYWLNIPSPGTACPKCHLPQPQIGINFLQLLGAR